MKVVNQQIEPGGPHIVGGYMNSFSDFEMGVSHVWGTPIPWVFAFLHVTNLGCLLSPPHPMKNDPSDIWGQEHVNMKTCRANMDHI